MTTKFDRGLNLNETLGTAKPVAKKFPKLPKRCKFFVACHRAPTRWAWHNFLQKDLPVCEHCFTTNDYLVHEGSLRSIIGHDEGKAL